MAYPVLSAYDFCGGTACAPQVGVEWVPQGGPETPQPEDRSRDGEQPQLRGSLSGTLHHPRWRREAAQEAGAKPQGVPGHQSSSEKPRTICQACKAEGDHPGIYSGCCGAHPRGSLWEGVQLNYNLPFRGFEAQFQGHV